MGAGIAVADGDMEHDHELTLTGVIEVLRAVKSQVILFQAQAESVLNSMQTDVTDKFRIMDGRLGGIEGRLGNWSEQGQVTARAYQDMKARADESDEQCASLARRLDEVQENAQVDGGWRARVDEANERLAVVGGRLDEVDKRSTAAWAEAAERFAAVDAQLREQAVIAEKISESTASERAASAIETEERLADLSKRIGEAEAAWQARAVDAEEKLAVSGRELERLVARAEVAEVQLATMQKRLDDKAGQASSGGKPVSRVVVDKMMATVVERLAGCEKRVAELAERVHILDVLEHGREDVRDLVDELETKVGEGLEQDLAALKEKVRVIEGDVELLFQDDDSDDSHEQGRQACRRGAGSSHSKRGGK